MPLLSAVRWRTPGTMWYSAWASGTRRSCSLERAPAKMRDLRVSPLWGGRPAAGRDAGAHRSEPGENVYIANIVKCRPPQNRDPLNTEQDACIDYLRNQVAPHPSKDHRLSGADRRHASHRA